MRFIGNSHLWIWGPRWVGKTYQTWPSIEYIKGGCVSDPACVFWHHLSVLLRVGRLFLGGFELMWGQE